MSETIKTSIINVKLKKPVKDRDEMLYADLEWRNGEFVSAIIKTENTGLYLSAKGYCAFRDLMSEIITTTNNPPVGCDPV